MKKNHFHKVVPPRQSHKDAYVYNVDGKIYFGELTFTSQGGFMDNITPDFNKELGDKFDIKDFPLKKNREFNI